MHFSRGGKMLLISALNDAILELPVEVKRLKTLIENIPWSNEKKTYALQIIRQLNTPKLAGFICKVRFKPLLLTLTLSEVERISKEKDKKAVIEYIEGILKDINQMSSLIRLMYGGHDFEHSDWTIYIDFYI